MAKNERVVKNESNPEPKKNGDTTMYKVVPEEIWDLALRKMEELTLIYDRTDDEINELRAWALLLSMDLPTEQSKKIMAAINPESEPQNRVKLLVIPGGLR
jgi:hypothetical protein